MIITLSIKEETIKKAIAYALKCAVPRMMEEKKLSPFKEGEVLNINGYKVQFEKGLFYEVKHKGIDEYYRRLWTRTGRVFSLEELQKVNEKTP